MIDVFYSPNKSERFGSLILGNANKGRGCRSEFCVTTGLTAGLTTPPAPPWTGTTGTPWPGAGAAGNETTGEPELA